MAENIILNPVSTFQNDSSAVATVNANMATITTAFVDVLSRSGVSPNTMQANLDMNSFRILNLPSPVQSLEPVRLIDIPAVTGAVSVVPAGGTTNQVLTKHSNADYDLVWAAGGAGTNILPLNNTFTGTNTFNPTSGNAITIAPLANSLNQGINVTQSSPTTGASSSSLGYNRLSVTHRINSTATGFTNGSPNFDVAGFRVDLFAGGGNTTGDNSFGGYFTASHNTSGGTVTAVRGAIGLAYSNQTTSGLHGLDGVAIVDCGGVVTQFGGVEACAGICNGSGSGGNTFCALPGVAGTAARRYGLTCIAAGETIATTTDTAIIIANGGLAGAAWNKLISLSNYGGQNPLSTSADFFYAEQSYTVANIFNLPNVTVSSNIMNFPSVVISGAGGATFGASTAPTAGRVQVTNASSGQVNLTTLTNGAGNSDFVQIVTSDGNNNASLRTWEPANTQSFWGISAMGNWSGVFSTATNNQGLAVGTTGNVPIIFGTNSALAGKITGGQQWVIGGASASSAVAPPTNTVLTVTGNSAATLTAGSLNNTMYVANATNTQSSIIFDGFGSTAANGSTFLLTRTGRGTPGAVTASQNNDILGFFGMIGATGTNTYAADNGSNGGVYFGGRTTETWSSTNQGTKLQLFTTQTGTNVIKETLTLNAPSVTLLPNQAVPAGGTQGMGYQMSSTANLGIFFGSGAPTLSAAQGSIYIRTDGSSTSTRLYVNTNGTTGWTNFTSAT